MGYQAGLSVCVRTRTCVHACSHVQLFLTPWTIAHQASLSMEFPATILEQVAVSSSKAGLSLALLLIQCFLRFCHRLLLGTERDTPTNGYFPYKCVSCKRATFTRFSELLFCLLFPKNRGSVSSQNGGMGREMGGNFKRETIYGYLWLIHVEV